MEVDSWLVLSRKLRKLVQLGLSWGDSKACMVYAVACQAPLEVTFAFHDEEEEARVTARAAAASTVVNGLRGDLGVEGPVTIKAELW